MFPKYRTYEQRKAFKRGVNSITGKELLGIVCLGIVLTCMLAA